jgi:hypothetical protein
VPEYVDYTTVPHLAAVEMGTAGMEWPSAAGPFTVTMEHLADIVVAANEDPHIQVPRLKLGHDSAVNGDFPDYDPFAAVSDAEPVFGRAVNLRTVNDGAVLIGDFVEVPGWLAESMPSAYPNRSCEWVRDIETPGGKRYSMVITAVSLLGERLPAIRDLEDLQRLIEDGPDAIATREGDVPGSATSVSWETIRERFNFEWAMDPESIFEGADGESIEPYWWWARDIRIDPAEVIADDEQGNLWSVPFETDGADAVEFGEPQRVREVYVPVNASQGEELHRTAVPRAGQRVLATNLDRPEKQQRQGAASAAIEATEEEATVPTTIERLRELGLPEDVTEEDVQTALADETPPDPDAQPDAPAAPAENPEQTPGGEPDPNPSEENAATAALGETIDRAALAQLQADAKAGREARQQQLSTERERLVETAVTKGKFPRSAAASYRAQLDKGGDIEVQTRQFIDGLAENTIPVEELGTETDGGSDSVATTGWFPQLAHKEA